MPSRPPPTKRQRTEGGISNGTYSFWICTGAGVTHRVRLAVPIVPVVFLDAILVDHLGSLLVHFLLQRFQDVVLWCSFIRDMEGFAENARQT